MQNFNRYVYLIINVYQYRYNHHAICGRTRCYRCFVCTFVKKTVAYKNEIKRKYARHMRTNSVNWMVSRFRTADQGCTVRIYLTTIVNVVLEYVRLYWLSTGNCVRGAFMRAHIYGDRKTTRLAGTRPVYNIILCIVAASTWIRDI